MSSAEPTVSIVIPNYNRQDLVGETIETALAQGPGVEVIAIDDGSRDDSWSVIQGYGDRIRSARQENAGLSAARNAGLDLARGRYVRFLDSDDRMPPGSLAAQLAYAERLPPRHIAVGDAVSIDEAGNRIPAVVGYGYAGQAPPGPLDRATVLRHIMNAWLPLFPADALHAIGGFNPEVVLIEDHELAMRLLRAGYGFARVAINVCEVREHGGDRLSRNIGAAGYRRLHQMYSRLWIGFEGWSGKLTGKERAALGQLVWTAARDAVRSGFAAEAGDLFALAERIGGRRARMGKLPIRLAYNLLSPLAAERLFIAAKKLAGRAA